MYTYSIRCHSFTKIYPFMATPFNLLTWNVHGLRMATRRREILHFLSYSNYHVCVLQETHFENENHRWAAQRQWTMGPSFWSYDGSGNAGLAILFKDRPDLRVETVVELEQGRLMYVDFTFVCERSNVPTTRALSLSFRLCAVYAPVKVAQRKSLWAKLKDATNTKRNLLVIGDFNNRAQPNDRRRYMHGQPISTPSSPLTVEESDLQRFLSETLGLRDKALEAPNSLNFFPISHKAIFDSTYQTRFNSETKFTFYHPRTVSRLDRLWAPASFRVYGCKLTLTPWSDHAMVGFVCNYGDVQPRGRPLWRLHQKLLSNEQMRDILSLELDLQVKIFMCEDRDVLGGWERLKKRIRYRMRMVMQRAHKKEIRDYQNAVARLLYITDAMNNGEAFDDSSRKRCLETIKRFQADLRQQRLNNRTFRTRGPINEKDDWAKNKLPRTHLFFHGLREKEGAPLVSDPNDMLQIMTIFYEQLYARKDISGEEVEAYLESESRAEGKRMSQALSDAECEGLLRTITPEELKKVISGGKATSAPGPDGLPWSFYKDFAEILIPALVKLYNVCLETGRLGQSFGEGLLLFFPKKGDTTLPGNWRPITLTNVDYRILAKALNGRLASVAHKLIHGFQTSAVPGRKMMDSLCLLRECFRSLQTKRWKGHLLLIDQVKAFDRIHHDFLWQVLKTRGIPSLFVSWIQLLYAKATATPQVNGWRGDPIPLRSGVRQGCPLSPLLYVLGLDPILARIQREPRLTGMTVPLSNWEKSPADATSSGENTCLTYRSAKFVAHADDITLLLSNKEEIGVVVELFTEYGKVSGSQLNTNKSVLVCVDHERQSLRRQPVVTESRKGNTEQTTENEWEDTVSILGIAFGLKKRVWEKNWKEWEEKVEKKLATWKHWELNMYQRAAYVRTYLIPMASNLAVVYPPPTELVRRVTGRLFGFLWKRKFFPLPRAEAYRQVEMGGLAMPALQPLLIAKFVSYNFGTWARLSVHDAGDALQGTWASLFASGWCTSAWGKAWWDRGTFTGNVTLAIRTALPDYIEELPVQLKKWKVESAAVKEPRSVRETGKALYEAILEEGPYQQAAKRRSERQGISAYLRVRGKEIALFKQREIPFHLWETRWRLYHQVLPLNTNRHWLPPDQRLCPRSICQQEAWELNVEYPETHSHFLTDCTVAKGVWASMARTLNWPELSGQGWEAIASGATEPHPLPGPKRKLLGKHDVSGNSVYSRWKVPTCVVWIINLYVTYALLVHRNLEIRQNSEIHPNKTVLLAWKLLNGFVQKEKWFLSKGKWEQRWKWTIEVDPPIT
nr:exonuclease-endonuclease-phosphatase domain superfamily [Nuttalliella namaqua]